MSTFRSVLILGGGLILGYFILWLTIGPKPIDYLRYIAESTYSKDESVSNVSCGNVTLKVIHSDEARPGAHATIAYGGYPPRLIDIYDLQGFFSNKEVFSSLSSQNATNRLPSVDNIITSFVVDRIAYEKVSNHQARGESTGTDGGFLVVSENTLSKEDLKSVAFCFSKHATELNTAHQWPIAAFIMLKDPHSYRNFATYGKFQCADGRSVQLDNDFNLAYVFDIKSRTRENLGTLTLSGYLHDWSTGGKADITRFADCKNDDGQTFPNYISQTAQKTESL